MTLPPTHRSIAVVMDPLDGIDIQADTTFVLMLEAQRRGHRLFSVAPANLGVLDGRATAPAPPVAVRRDPGAHSASCPPGPPSLHSARRPLPPRSTPPPGGNWWCR